MKYYARCLRTSRGCFRRENCRKNETRAALLPGPRPLHPARCASKSGRGCKPRRDAGGLFSRTRSDAETRSIETRIVAFKHRDQDCANRNFIPKAKIFPRSGITALFARSSRSEQKAQL